MALAFGGLSFTALKDSSIEVDNHGTKQSLNYSDIKELKSWLENVIYEFHNHPPSYLGGVGVNAQEVRFHNQNPFAQIDNGLDPAIEHPQQVVV